MSRNSGPAPALSRIATIDPIGSARYSDGKSAPDIAASAPPPPCQVFITTSAMAMNCAIRVTSMGSRRPLMVPTNVASVKRAAATVGHFGTWTPLARNSSTSSSTPTNRSATATASKIGSGANHTTPMARATSAAPVSRRAIRDRQVYTSPQQRRLSTWLIERRSLRAKRDRRVDAAVPAVALLVGNDRFEKVAAAEIGPQRFGDPDLSIGDLPQQKIADAHLAAGPNQEIGIRLAGGVEKIAEALLIECICGNTGGDRAARGINDLRPTTIVQRDVETHARVRRGLADAGLQFAPDIRRELVGPPDDLKSNVVSEQRLELKTQVPLQERHQCVDFS